MAVALCSVAAGGALASDGVIEINQVRALAGGVTPGDSPDFPVTIDRPGSYVLTGNLDVQGAPAPYSTTAIEFVAGAEGATLDLNGFVLVGPRGGPTCPLPCPSTGAGVGIRIGADFVSVANGTVRGFGSNGIDSASSGKGGGTLADLRVFGNGNEGIYTAGHRILRCESSSNLAHGFRVITGSILSSRAKGNGINGFYTDRAIVSESLAEGNAVQGFDLAASSADSCVASNNSLFGFKLGGSILTNSLSVGNNPENVSIFCIDGAIAATAINHGSSQFQAGCVQLGPNLCNNAPCP
jgi:hypothetical protein